MARAILLALMVLGYPFSDSLAGNPWLYMFAHASIAHLLLNAITLWSFGKPVEKDIGPALTVALFLAAGWAGGAIQSLITPGVAIMGASAAIFALIGFYVGRHRNRRIGLPMLMFTGRRVLVVLMVATVLCMLFGWAPSIAHAAHLTGMLFGLLVAIA